MRAAVGERCVGGCVVGDVAGARTSMVGVVGLVSVRVLSGGMDCCSLNPRAKKILSILY